MAKRVVITCAGIATDPNPFVAGPAGGMRKADNIVIAQDGVASPRPSFPIDTTKDTVFRPRSMTVYQNQPVIQSFDLDNDLLRLETDDAVIASGTNDVRLTPMSYPFQGLQFAESRKNLYWGTANGPYKLTSYNSEITQSGMHEATSGKFSVALTNPSASAMPPDTVRAWRWCFVKRDANGLETRSAPSPWQSYANDTFNEYKDITWQIPLPTYVNEGDQIELYASYTVPTGSIPFDTLYLSKRQTVSSSDLSTGYAQVRDSSPDDRLGVELYTNPTREGILKANYRPPASVALAQWENCMWFGNTRGPWTAKIDVVSSSGTTTTAGAAGLQRFRTSYSGVSGSTLTGISDTSSVRVGQYVTDNGSPSSTTGRIPVGTLVVSVATGSVTLSQEPSGTGFVYFHDGVTVGSKTWWAAVSEYDISDTEAVFGVYSDETRTAKELAYAISLYSADQFAYAIEDPYVVTDAYGTAAQGTLIIRNRDLDGDQFAFSSTREDAFSYKIDQNGDPLVERTGTGVNVLYYSKPYEPEHVPETNFLVVGEESAPILAVVPLKYALLVFKTDGVFRVTGNAPDNWSVEVLDEGTRLLRGTAVDVLDDAAYALTDRGMVRVTANDVLNVANSLVAKEMFEALLEVNAIDAAHIFVRAWRAANVVLVNFSLPEVLSEESTTYSPNLFVFNTTTGAWTKWDLNVACASQDDGNDTSMYLMEATDWKLRDNATVYADSSTRGYDTLYQISGWTYSHTSGTLTLTTGQLNGWEPKSCDWVSADYSGSEFLTWNYSGGTNLVVPKSQPNLVIDGECVAIDGGEEVWASVISGSLAWTPSEGDTISAIELGDPCTTTPEVRRVLSVEETSTAFRLQIDRAFSHTDQTNRKFSLSGYRRVVSASTDADTGDVTVTLDSPFSFELFTNRKAYEGMECVLEWQAQTGEDPFATARLQEIQVAVDWSASDTYNPNPHIEIGASTDRQATPAMVEVDVSRTDNEPYSRHLRGYPDPNIVHASHYYPKMSVCALDLSWRCLGMALLMEPVSTNRTTKS